MEYYSRNPFGELREDLRNALNCCVTYATIPGKKKKRTTKDFMLKVKSAKKQPLTEEELQKELKAFDELRKNGRKGNR